MQKIPCVPIFRQNGQLWLFWPKFAQKWIFGWKFRKLISESESASLRYHVCQFSGKTNNFDFLDPNLPKNGFWGRKVKNLSLDLESAPPRHHFQFSVKMDNFEVFNLNLGKLPNYVRYFGSNIVEGVAESWMEAEKSWVKVDGAWWRWVARFSNTL